ncbi:MAG: DUF3857 domain-containing protein [Gammaproteobacteria bacterium]|nr:DUF3857 domain-containing protein [Gammaproteobacteria bacterium]MDH5213282.1 DUF3857 domain-containing protein [Gammaproteobacteria bacterium]
MKTVIALMLALAVLSANAQEHTDYSKKAGKRVGVFRSEALNYQLDLSDLPYTYINFTKQVPEASFAGMQFNPSVISMVIAEDVGVIFSAGQYAELVRSAMTSRLEGDEDVEVSDFRDLGERTAGDRQAHQVAIFGTAESEPVIYVVSTLVDRTRAYQVLTFGTNQPEDVVVEAANAFLSAFSIVDTEAMQVSAERTRPVDDYRSQTFGYRFRTDSRDWFSWADLVKDYESADIGALSSKGYGTIVLPVCWNGAAPPENAVFSVFMKQFGEDYPSDFIKEEQPVTKGDASGRLFIGRDNVDGEDYDYYLWVVANANCAYTLAAWAPAKDKKAGKELRQLWSDFDVEKNPAALSNYYAEDKERRVNAFLLNGFGLHYFEARAYRDAYRFFSQASDLDTDDEAYVVNALRALVEIEAFHEAAEWLTPRLAAFADNKVVQSWDAWLAYQTDDAAKAMRVYEGLFAAGYRDDDDFGVYLTMLADAGLWDELDGEFAAYTAAGGSESTQVLKARLLSRRGRHEDALAVLDQVTKGRPFDADMVYERIGIVYEMDNPAEVLRLAELLIENGYRSLQSYYYKGDAEFQLRWYQKARESFERAQSYSPTNANIKEYLDAIDQMLGEGENASISVPIDVVPLSKDLQKVFSSSAAGSADDGFGAVYASRITGYRFDESESVSQTQYRKIRILDDNGIKQFSTLEFDFDPAFEQLYVNSIVVRDGDGKVLAEGERNAYYVTNSDNSYEASTEKTVHIPVPSLARGVTIEAIVSKTVSVEKGTFPLEVVYLSTDRPIEYSAVFVSGEQKPLQYQSNGVGAPRKSGATLIWEMRNPAPYRWEPLQPYFDQILPWVYFGTVSKDWREAGIAYLDKIRDKLDISQVEERARRMVDGVDDTQRKIEILSAHVQNEIHYEAIEFGRRAYIPKTARETMRDRYGDCKDHSVLLYSMLQSVGIPASLALVNLNEQVIAELPNVDQFDHMIVAVEVDGGRHFIDPTDKDLRLGKLPPRSMAGNFALLLDEQPALVKIPGYESGLVGLSIERTVEAVSAEEIKVTEAGRFSGYQAAELRGQLRDIESSEMQASLQRWVASRYSDAEVTEVFVDNVFDASYDLIVELQYTMPVDDDGTFDLPGFMESYYLEFERVADRRFPFQQVFPLRVSAVTSLKAPEGRQITIATKKPDEDESRFGNWQRQLKQGADAWEIRFDYVADESRFDAGDYKAFAEFHRKLVDAIEQPLILQ